MTISVVWAFTQFQKHDYKAPWLVYAALMLPVIFFVIELSLTGELPPQLDALAPR